MNQNARFGLHVIVAIVGGWALYGWRGALALVCVYLIWGPR